MKIFGAPGGGAKFGIWPKEDKEKGCSWHFCKPHFID